MRKKSYITTTFDYALKTADAVDEKIAKGETLKPLEGVPMAIKDNISNKSTYIEYIKENVLEADLVVWDDLGNKMGSEFELSHLLSIIDNRITLGKSNIYTSNLTRQQLYSALGERLTSRVANMSIDIELFGSDKRNLKLGE